jgi:hypothetical protein
MRMAITASHAGKTGFSGFGTRTRCGQIQFHTAAMVDASAYSHKRSCYVLVFCWLICIPCMFAFCKLWTCRKLPFAHFAYMLPLFSPALPPPEPVWHTRFSHTRLLLLIYFCLVLGLQGMSIKTYVGHGQEVHDVAIAEDNSRIASVGGDKLVLYWVRTLPLVLKKLLIFSHAVSKWN